jgi:hypothetical protein
MGRDALESRVLDLVAERREIVAGDDGYYVYWPDGYKHGALTARDLRLIADHLDRHNGALDHQLDEYFNTLK